MNKKGMTLVEIMITAAILVVVAGVTLTVYIAALRSWRSQEVRAGISIVLDRAMEEVARDVREAKEVDTSINADEIRFTQDQTDYYIYYLYNSSDSYPSAFGQSSYELRKAALTGVIDGTFTYGGGKLIISDVVPPPTSDLSDDGSLVTIDLSVTRGDNTIREKTKVKPRNL